MSEGPKTVVTITLRRDLSVWAGRLVVDYATSDLTAKGVDSAHFAECELLPVGLRAAHRCGDYEHTTGRMEIAPGVASGGFTVRIADDYCFEPRPRFFQVKALCILSPIHAALTNIFVIVADPFGARLVRSSARRWPTSNGPYR